MSYAEYSKQIEEGIDPLSKSYFDVSIQNKNDIKHGKQKPFQNMTNKQKFWLEYRKREQRKKQINERNANYFRQSNL